MLGEFFLARPDEVESFLDDPPFDRTEVVTAKTVSDISIATLGEILGVGSYDELSERIEGGGYFAPDDESGIFPVPRELRDALAGADRADVAERWVRTDEMAGWTPAEALEVLDGLEQLVRDAGDRELWFWWSL